MVGRLFALDKCPGIQPIGVGETWWRLTAKATLLAAGSKTKELCSILQSWKPASSMPSMSCGSSAKMRRSRDFYSLMHLMHSIMS
jgi:hypothetical protein